MHKNFQVEIEDLSGKFHISTKVCDQHRICGSIARVTKEASILKCLEGKGIRLSDVGYGSPKVELLLGADVYGSLLTGKVEQLANGAVAVQTKLGWTLVGDLSHSVLRDNLVMVVTDSSLAKFWEIEHIGIKDPIGITTAQKQQELVKKSLIDSMQREPNGRYSVKLPWKASFPSLPTNREVAVKRLQTTTNKLIASNLFKAYGKLISEWKNEGFIELVANLNERKRPFFTT